MEQWDIYDRERRLTGRTMKKNDWILSLMLRAQGSIFSNIKPIEKRWIRTNLKKALQHAHVQRLAKAPRTREEVHFSPILEQVNN